jgi:hypothetical protein
MIIFFTILFREQFGKFKKSNKIMNNSLTFEIKVTLKNK